MKPRTLILMTTAILCGLGASYLTSRLLAERNTAQAEVAQVPILVAKKHLDQATHLKNPADYFEFKNFSQDTAPKNAVTDFGQIKGKFLARSLRKGDFLTLEDVKDNVAVIPVPPGMRAVGLRVNLESIAGGFASLPGSRVDIISTVRGKNNDESGSFYLLENVLVLAADTIKERPDSAIPASVVTVALSPEDVLRVTQAKELGSLTLVLRDPTDPSRAQRWKMSVTEVLHGQVKSAEAADYAAKGQKALAPSEEGDTFVPPVGPPSGTAAAEKKPVSPEKTPPAAKEPAAEPAETTVKAPEPRRHIVLVQEGERLRRVVFRLREDGLALPEEDSTGAPPAAVGNESPPQPPASNAAKEKRPATLGR